MNGALLVYPPGTRCIISLNEVPAIITEVGVQSGPRVTYHVVWMNAGLRQSAWFDVEEVEVPEAMPDYAIGFR